MQAEETESVEVQEEPAASAQAPEADSNDPQELAQQKKRNSLEYNWAEARRSIEQRDKEIKDLKNQLQSLAPKKEEVNVDEDSLLTAKDGRKVFRQEAEAIVQQALRQYEASTIEERLLAKYPDFNEVVSAKNIELLKET